MSQRSIDGPRKNWLTIEECASFLCVSVSTFQRVAGLGKSRHASELPGVREWFRSRPGKGPASFYWMDLVTLTHILSRRDGPVPADEVDEK